MQIKIALLALVALLISSCGATAPAPEPNQAVPTDVPLPRFSTQTEALSAYARNQIPSLEALSDRPEDYAWDFEAGKTYSYEIALEENQEVMWLYSYCTMPDNYDENWENLTISLSLNGEEIPLSETYLHDTNVAGFGHCRRYVLVLSDWHAGDYTIQTEVELAKEVSDGWNDLAPGLRTYIYEITVGG
jgi:hypothetical protein